MTTPPQYQKILDYIDIAKNEGARAVLGGAKATRPECGEGWFVEPTIFTGVKAGSRLDQEEIFGPVLVVIPYDTEEEAIEIANDSIYGLAAAALSGLFLILAIRVGRRERAGSAYSMFQLPMSAS